MLGHWLYGSGWVQYLVQADVTTSGIADSFIKASNVKRTRYAHIVTATVLHICQRKCYSQYCDSADITNKLTFNQWRSERSLQSTQFQYWDTVLELELTMLTFLHSIRKPNFALYVESLEKLLPWFFALDQTHYARWLSVHLSDMLNLNNSHPTIASEFLNGNFTVSKTNKHFSAIAIDQAHEQLNAVIKGDGGAIGLTESDAALDRWIISGPEIIRLLAEFEGTNFQKQDLKHHEQALACQKLYQQDVNNLLQFFDEKDNPFNERAGDDVLLN